MDFTDHHWDKAGKIIIYNYIETNKWQAIGFILLRLAKGISF